MELTAIKDLMAQFDASSLREFSYQNAEETLTFSKNEASPVVAAPAPVAVAPGAASTEVAPAVVPAVETAGPTPSAAEGDVVDSPLVGVAYLAPSPDKPAFVQVGDSVKKGQTLLIIEAMKVMNEVPAPRDGVVTEILVVNEDVIEFGQGLVRIK